MEEVLIKFNNSWVKHLFLVLLLSIMGSSCSITPSVPKVLPSDHDSDYRIFTLAQYYEKSDVYYQNLSFNNLARLDDYYIVDEQIIGKASGEKVLSFIDGFLGRSDEVVMCFNPRHAIQYKSKGKMVTLLVCFQCKKVHQIVNGVKEVMRMPDGDRSKLDLLYSKIGVQIPTDPMSM